MGKFVLPLCQTFADHLSFGAVLEEFEVRDALANVFNIKTEVDMVD